MNRIWDLSSPTKDQTFTPLHWMCGFLITEPPAKSPSFIFFFQSYVSVLCHYANLYHQRYFFYLDFFLTLVGRNTLVIYHWVSCSISTCPSDYLSWMHFHKDWENLMRRLSVNGKNWIDDLWVGIEGTRGIQVPEAMIDLLADLKSELVINHIQILLRTVFNLFWPSVHIIWCVRLKELALIYSIVTGLGCLQFMFSEPTY